MTRSSRRAFLLGLLVLVAVVALAACRTTSVDVVRPEAAIAAPTSFDHSDFDAILGRYVTDGLVDYEALGASGALDPYLRRLAETDPQSLGEDDQLAFWLNAYNALTIKLILDNYPTAGILRLTPVGVRGTTVLIPKINSPFEQTVGIVGGKERSLEEIEHGIIRAEFDEPRIHFALVCAALSCPPLRAEAYTGADLDAQLQDQGDVFLHDERKNVIPGPGGERIHISKIFKWFGGDFGDGDAGVQKYLAQFFDGEVAEKLSAGGYDIDHTRYDWTLNDTKNAGEHEAVEL